MRHRSLSAAAVFGLVVIVGFARVTSAAADDRRVGQQDIDALVTPLIEAEWCVGAVVGVIDEQGTRVFGYGRLSRDDSRKPDGDSVFEIGSITKGFTGILLADMVGRGEVALDDPAQKLLPASVKLRVFEEQPITLEHLTTHASGLPRLPGDFAPADWSNPYADYTADRMYAFLNEFKPKRAPRAQFEYSNLGTGLLGHLLALRAGKGYEALVAERILDPLGMSDTYFDLPGDARARLARGHNADGETVGNWDFSALAAAGALRSTANDMLKFLAAAIAAADAPSPGSSPLANAIALAITPRAPASGNNDVGFGWHVRLKDGVVWHNGGTGGYNAYCAWVPRRKAGVVVLVNTAGDCADVLGYTVMQRLLGNAKFEPTPRRTVTQLTPDVLDRRVGRYAILPGFSLTVMRDGERLYCQATDQPAFRIYPESETDFFYKVVDARISFKLDKSGRAFMLTLHQNGLKLPGIRVVDDPATQPATQAATQPATQPAERSGS
jgi:serine-type D-Ala-D-Ala carboxypeptidase/endopeptidase